jgi:hypothetical protein
MDEKEIFEMGKYLVRKRGEHNVSNSNGIYSEEHKFMSKRFAFIYENQSGMNSLEDQENLAIYERGLFGKLRDKIFNFYKNEFEDDQIFYRKNEKLEKFLIKARHEEWEKIKKHLPI